MGKRRRSPISWITKPRHSPLPDCLFLARGLAEPVVEARRADAWVVAWDERSIVQFQAEIGRVRISDHFARVVRRFQKSPDELAERRPLGTGDLDRGVRRRGEGDL